MGTFSEMVGDFIQSMDEAALRRRRAELRKTYPGTPDVALDRIAELESLLGKVITKKDALEETCNLLEQDLERYDSNLTTKEIRRRREMAELRLVELKIKNLEADV